MIKIQQLLLNQELKNQIQESFTQHAIATIGHDEKFENVAFVAMENDTVAGIVVAQLFWGALHIKTAVVNQPYRNRGLGTKLMEKALNYGQENKCPFAFVETMSFQALGFYQKLGFKLEFTRTGYAHKTSFHYLKKELETKEIAL